MARRYLKKSSNSQFAFNEVTKTIGGFCYNSFMVFGALDHFEKTGPTNTLLKVAKS